MEEKDMFEKTSGEGLIFPSRNFLWVVWFCAMSLAFLSTLKLLLAVAVALVIRSSLGVWLVFLFEFLDDITNTGQRAERDSSKYRKADSRHNPKVSKLKLLDRRAGSRLARFRLGRQVNKGDAVLLWMPSDSV